MLTLCEITIEFYVEFWVENSPNIILQSNMERFSRIIRSAQGQNVDFGREGAEERCRDLDTCGGHS